MVCVAVAGAASEPAHIMLPPSTESIARLLEATGRFRVLGELGQGGTGVVYRVHDAARGEEVALKTLRIASASSLYQLKREFRALADVVHENLVQLHDLSCVGDQWCLTMELVEGRDFVSHVCGGQAVAFAAQTTTVSLVGRSDVPLPRGALQRAKPASTVDLALLRPAIAQLTSAVQALHAAGRLHLDLKPMNVLVRHDGRVVVLDFGLVREIDARAGFSELLGTPAYMAPEQTEEATPTAAADWYAVGAMLYEALTGLPPFGGAPSQLLLDKISRDPLPPHELAEGVPRSASALCMQLLARDPAQRAGRVEIARWLGADDADERAPSSAARGPLPFVGRSQPLATLTAAHARVLAGEAMVVFLHGESGIGKTALAHEFLRRAAHEERALVLEGRCLERESVPYKALDSVVDALCRELVRLGPGEVDALAPRDLDALLRAFPMLQRVPALATSKGRSAPSSSSQHEREHAFAALKQLLARLASRLPLIIFIDDLQWGDRDSALLVRELLTPPDPPRILWIGTYRSEERASSAFLRSFLTEGAVSLPEARVVHVELEGLDRSELLELLLGLSLQEGVVLESTELIASESSGNPFLAGELVRALASGSSERQRDGAVSLEGVLRARVARLLEPERILVEAVAVIGHPIERALALKLVQLEHGGQGALDRLRGARLVRTRTSGERELVEPYHDRIREVLGQAVAPTRRAELHRRYAFELESRTRGDPEVLMLHYAEAGELERAASYAMQAADLAHQALAFDHAATLFRRALDWWQSASARERMDLEERLGRALERAGRSAEAAEAYLAAAEQAEMPHTFDLRRMAAEQLLVCGRYARGIGLLRDTLPAFGLRLAKSSLRAILSLLLRRALLSLRGFSFRARAESQVPLRLLSRIDAAYAVANGLGMLDSLVAADVQTKGVALALRAGEPLRVVRALCYESAFRCASVGGHEKTRRIVARARQLATELKRPEALGLAEMADGFFEHHGTGTLARARAPYERSEALLLNVPGMNGELMTMRCNLLTLLDWTGNIDALQARIPTLAQQADRRGDHFLATGIVSAALYWLGRDRADELTRHTEVCRKLWPSDLFVMPFYWLLVAEAQRDLYTGDAALCLTRIAESWPALSSSWYLSIPTVRIEVCHPRARAALLRAARGEARVEMLRLARRDARLLEKTRRGYAGALASLLHAGCAAVAGRRDELPALLERAVEHCDREALHLYARAGEYQLGRLEGGDAGRARTRRAAEAMRAAGVVNVARLADALAPGFFPT